MTSNLRRPFRLAVTTAVLTVALMGLGGVVHATGSSLACPDWPLCHGQWFPAMIGGVALEHGHRLLAGAVAVLTAWLAHAAHGARREDPVVMGLGWAALALVLVQAVLGGITVLAELSTWASTLHLAVSMSFLAVVILIALRCSDVRPPFHLRWPSPSRTRGAVAWVGGLLFGQIVLGGLVRHTGAAMACGRDPIGCEALAWSDASLARLQVIHRVAAVCLAVAIPILSVVLARSGDRASVWLGGVASVLVLAQIGLGAWSVLGALPVFAVTAHLVAAALLWAVFVVLGWRFGVLAVVPWARRSATDVPSAETA